MQISRDANIRIPLYYYYYYLLQYIIGRGRLLSSPDEIVLYYCIIRTNILHNIKHGRIGLFLILRVPKVDDFDFI